MIQKILDAITIEGAVTGIGYSIIANLIVRFFDCILKSDPDANEKSKKWDLINIGELIGCLGAILVITVFVFVYVLGALDKILTIDELAEIFLICYGGFLFLYVIHSLLSVIKGEANLVKNMEGISLMILFPSVFILLLFQVKAIVEMNSGMTLKEVDVANEGLMDYLRFLMKAILVSGGFLILSKLLNLVLDRDEN